jgi:hypothetical protein
MKYGPFDYGNRGEIEEVFPVIDSQIKRWVKDHEEMEEEIGIVSPQEDVPHVHHSEEDEEDTELVYHFR